MYIVEEKRKIWEEEGVVEIFDRLKEEGRVGIDLVGENAPEQCDIIGGTRIGGEPDLPPDLEWPYSGDGDLHHPMAFVAQINLDDVANQVEYTGDLPKSGILYFFRNDSDDIGAYGLELEDFIHSKVIHYTGPTDVLTRRPFPEELGEYERYKPQSFILINDFSLPESSFSPWGEAFDTFDDDFLESVEDALYDLPDYNARDAQLLGHPHYIQGAVEEEATCPFTHFDVKKKTLPEEWREKLAEPFGRDPKDWRQLLAVTSIDECDMMWGDAGTIYFMITEEDLKGARFDRVLCIFQCS